MRKLIVFVFLILFILSGCSTNQSLSAKGTGKHWSVVIDYELTGDRIHHSASLTFSGDKIPQEFSIIADYPGVNSSYPKPIKVEDTSKKTIVISDIEDKKSSDLTVTTLKRLLSQDSELVINWSENGINKSETLKFEIE